MKEDEINGTYSTHWEMSNAYIILFADIIKIRLFGRSSFVRNNNIKIYLGEKRLD